MKSNKSPKNTIVIFLTTLNIFLSGFLTYSYGQLHVTDLRTEYIENPIGLGTTHPRLFWKLHSDKPNQEQMAYQVLVASSPTLLTEKKADMWNSGKILSGQSIQVEYSGKALGSRDLCWWKVRVWDRDNKPSEWSLSSKFEIGLISANEWKGNWIKTAKKFNTYSYPSPMFRKDFSLKGKIKKARVYITSLGLYELHVNGEKISDHLLRPGFTSYEERVQYQVYDVTTNLKSGNNAIGIVLGNGWYRNFRINPNEVPDLVERERPDLLVIAQLEVTFTDGTSTMITTGPGWKSSTGPVLMTSIYNGETFDARLQKDGWEQAGYNDYEWTGVEVVNLVRENIKATIGPPVRRIEEIIPVRIIYTPNGDTLVDMGQNMVGWCRLKVNCPAGTAITLKHGEVLDKYGNIYTENLRTAKQTITYYCKGGGKTESYEPRFTFQGFRYVKVSGYPKEVTKDMLTGIVIHSDMERTGYFSCNDSLINRLYMNVLWTQKGNSVDLPTDCPQRDERLGWTGDGQIFGQTANLNFHTPGFYTKWLEDIIAGQDSSGGVSATSPDKLKGEVGWFGWGDAAVTMPWLLYQDYFDKHILADHYKSMKLWLHYQFRKNHQLSDFHWGGTGDWLAFQGNYREHYATGFPTDKDLLGTAFFYHITDIVGKTAEILGERDEAVYYQELASKIKSAFREEFITPFGRLADNTQTAYAVALSFGLIPDEYKVVASKKLAEYVRMHKITTGVLGTREILDALTDFGFVEEAYKLLFSQNFPSWLYQINMGATTIWERWDGIRPDTTFQIPLMNSFNHPAFGSIGSWLYRKVAGIEKEPGVPGYKAIIIKPYPGGKINIVDASYESLYGTIRSNWKIENGRFKLKVQIPVNTMAKICIPSQDKVLFMNGKLVPEVEQETQKGLTYHFNTIKLGSGVYEFESHLNLHL